jgi:hypothetical protein
LLIAGFRSSRSDQRFATGARRALNVIQSTWLDGASSGTSGVDRNEWMFMHPASVR